MLPPVRASTPRSVLEWSRVDRRPSPRLRPAAVYPLPPAAAALLRTAPQRVVALGSGLLFRRRPTWTAAVVLPAAEESDTARRERPRRCWLCRIGLTWFLFLVFRATE